MPLNLDVWAAAAFVAAIALVGGEVRRLNKLVTGLRDDLDLLGCRSDADAEHTDAKIGRLWDRLKRVERAAGVGRVTGPFCEGHDDHRIN